MTNKHPRTLQFIQTRSSVAGSGSTAEEEIDSGADAELGNGCHYAEVG